MTFLTGKKSKKQGGVEHNKNIHFPYLTDQFYISLYFFSHDTMGKDQYFFGEYP